MWVSALWGTLPPELNEIVLTNALPRNGRKIFQRQLVAFSQVQQEQREGWFVQGEVPGPVATTEIMAVTDEGLIPLKALCHFSPYTSLQVGVLVLYFKDEKIEVWGC